MLLDALAKDPFVLKYEKLKGKAENLFSIRINVVGRLVFEIEEPTDGQYKEIANVIRMQTHYKGIIPIFLL